jgi:hypothetical protein
MWWAAPSDSSDMPPFVSTGDCIIIRPWPLIDKSAVCHFVTDWARKSVRIIPQCHVMPPLLAQHLAGFISGLCFLN